MGIRPAKDLSSSHTPDTAEDSKPAAELPLLLRPAAAHQLRISAAKRSRSLYFRCKKQQKQLVHRVTQLMQLDVPSALSRQGQALRAEREKPCSLPRDDHLLFDDEALDTADEQGTVGVQPLGLG